MHPMMHELVRSLRGLIHHCRMQDKKMSDHLFSQPSFFQLQLCHRRSQILGRDFKNIGFSVNYTAGKYRSSSIISYQNTSSCSYTTPKIFESERKGSR